MTGAPRTAAIMQPTWLPYLGYFQLIAEADVFVFLDDVQFARRSWQSRNRILDSGEEVLLSVGLKKQPRDTDILDIEIDDTKPWRTAQLAAIAKAYGGQPHFTEGFAFLEEQFAAHRNGRLADLTCGLIESAASRIGLATPFVRASALGCGGVRSEHLLALCRAVGAADYLSPTGSTDYIAEDAVFATAGFPVRFRTFAERPYSQGHGEPFIAFMSFVDALMNVGWNGLAELTAP